MASSCDTLTKLWPPYTMAKPAKQLYATVTWRTWQRWNNYALWHARDGRVSTLIYFKLLPHLSRGTTTERLEKYVFRYPMAWPRFVRHVSVEGSILDKTRRCCITWYDDELL